MTSYTPLDCIHVSPSSQKKTKVRFPAWTTKDSSGHASGIAHPVLSCCGGQRSDLFAMTEERTLFPSTIFSTRGDNG